MTLHGLWFLQACSIQVAVSRVQSLLRVDMTSAGVSSPCTCTPEEVFVLLLVAKETLRGKVGRTSCNSWCDVNLTFTVRLLFLYCCKGKEKMIFINPKIWLDVWLAALLSLSNNNKSCTVRTSKDVVKDKNTHIYKCTQRCRRRTFKNHSLKWAAFKVSRRKCFLTQQVIKLHKLLPEDVAKAKNICAFLKGHSWKGKNSSCRVGLAVAFKKLMSRNPWISGWQRLARQGSFSPVWKN